MIERGIRCRPLTNSTVSLPRVAIELIVAPVPAKPTIYPERFSSRLEDASTAVQNPSYQRFLERMAQARHSPRRLESGAHA